MTDNHFNLKLETRPMFEVFGSTLAHRTVNKLREGGILAPWVDAIFCTEGEEAESFVDSIGARLGVSADRIVKIGPTVRAAAGRPGIDPGLEDWISEQIALRGQFADLNVILVDQAAHHLRTLSALRKVVDAFGCRALAFVVFVDRTGRASELSVEMYHGMHFLPLYSWDCPPWRSFECPCGASVTLRL